MARGALVLDPVEASRAALGNQTTRLVSGSACGSGPVSPLVPTGQSVPVNLVDSTIFRLNFTSPNPQITTHKDSLEYGEPCETIPSVYVLVYPNLAKQHSKHSDLSSEYRASGLS